MVLCGWPGRTYSSQPRGCQTRLAGKMSAPGSGVSRQDIRTEPEIVVETVIGANEKRVLFNNAQANRMQSAIRGSGATRYETRLSRLQVERHRVIRAGHATVGPGRCSNAVNCASHPPAVSQGQDRQGGNPPGAPRPRREVLSTRSAIWMPTPRQSLAPHAGSVPRRSCRVRCLR